MKLRHTYIFTISLFITGSLALFAQDSPTPVKQIDSTVYKSKYGLRLGVDLSKPIRSFLDKNYTGFSIAGDYRVRKNYYVAAELGNENYAYTEPYIDAETKGSYAKVGLNINTYDNWPGMLNELFVGFRYGFATFSQTLNNYAIYTTDNYFEPDIREAHDEFKGLTANWLEFQLGIKAELINNVYLSIHVELKHAIGEKKPADFDNLFIPGFQRKYGGSKFGVGWGYTLSYLIPFYKK